MKKIFITFFILISVSTYSFDLYQEVGKGPVVVPVYDQQKKLTSVRGTMLMNIPYEFIWEAITDIASYKEFYPRMIKSNVKKTENNGKTIIADFEIEVPIFNNTIYANKYLINQEKGIVDIYQHSGQLEGSHFHWSIQKKDHGYTWVSYNGISKNYSPIIEKIDDKDQAIALTINLTTIVTTLRQVDERARFLQKKKAVK